MIVQGGSEDPSSMVVTVRLSTLIQPLLDRCFKVDLEWSFNDRYFWDSFQWRLGLMSVNWALVVGHIIRGYRIRVWKELELIKGWSVAPKSRGRKFSQCHRSRLHVNETLRIRGDPNIFWQINLTFSCCKKNSNFLSSLTFVIPSQQNS